MARIALVLALGLAFAACGDSEKLDQLGEKAAATWKAAAEFTAEQKDKALAFFGKRMTELEGQWQKAKEKGSGWSADAKQALEGKWADVQAAYAKTKEATGDAWVKARDGFKAAYDAFKAELAKNK
ncbi:MAG: hypothetical protein QNJ90_06595 [Planctomycetota bacterium]|nr:hypothetical protein [Planctomycetota bacterium]